MGQSGPVRSETKTYRTRDRVLAIRLRLSPRMGQDQGNQVMHAISLALDGKANFTVWSGRIHIVREGLAVRDGTSGLVAQSKQVFEPRKSLR